MNFYVFIKLQLLKNKLKIHCKIRITTPKVFNENFF